MSVRDIDESQSLDMTISTTSSPWLVMAVDAAVSHQSVCDGHYVAGYGKQGQVLSEDFDVILLIMYVVLANNIL